MEKRTSFLDATLALATFGIVTAFLSSPASALEDMVEVKVTIENPAPDGGGYLTPVWIGFHDGTFDLFDPGQPASTGLERLAEDGDSGVLQQMFAASGVGSLQMVVTSGDDAPVFAPGDSHTITVTVDRNSSTAQYLSFAAMVIPSNDAFVANENPLQIPVFDENGDVRADLNVALGSMVYDAGTEVNDEIPENTAFLAQAAPDTGVTEGGMIMLHAGFKAVGGGGILDDPRFTNADFTAEGYSALSLRAFQQLIITHVERNGASVSLTWTGGRPPFSVEMSPTLQTNSWEAVMNGVEAREAEVAVTPDMAPVFTRIVEQPTAPETATFELTFDATWSRATHPTAFPSSAHFSGLVGATHNADASFWEPGGMATPGIRSMAETGSKSPLTAEVQAAINAKTARELVSGGGISRSPGKVAVTFTAARQHPLLSLVSMVAPSPDWFIGVHGLELFQNGAWIDAMTVELPPYDAGTDSGTTFTAPNAATSPRDPITLLDEPIVQIDGDSPAFGTFMIRRIQ